MTTKAVKTLQRNIALALEIDSETPELADGSGVEVSGLASITPSFWVAAAFACFESEVGLGIDSELVSSTTYNSAPSYSVGVESSS